MKFCICDICYKQDQANKLVESTHRVGYQRHGQYNIDVCAEHHESYILEGLPKHIQFVLGLDGININADEASRLALHR